MRNYTKKFKKEWEFFINPKTDNVTFHPKCAGCKWDCKQSYRVELVRCPHYEEISKEVGHAK